MANITKQNAKEFIAKQYEQESENLQGIKSVDFEAEEVVEMLGGMDYLRIYRAKNVEIDDQETVVLVGVKDGTEKLDNMVEYGIEVENENPLAEPEE
jgi:hypothetical protein